MAITDVNAERKVIDRKKKESVMGGYCYYVQDNYFTNGICGETKLPKKKLLS